MEVAPSCNRTRHHGSFVYRRDLSISYGNRETSHLPCTTLTVILLFPPHIHTFVTFPFKFLGGVFVLCSFLLLLSMFSVSTILSCFHSTISEFPVAHLPCTTFTLILLFLPHIHAFVTFTFKFLGVFVFLSF